MLIINDWQLGQQLNVHQRVQPDVGSAGAATLALATFAITSSGQGECPAKVNANICVASCGSPMVSCDWGTLEHGKANPTAHEMPTDPG